VISWLQASSTALLCYTVYKVKAASVTNITDATVTWNDTVIRWSDVGLTSDCHKNVTFVLQPVMNVHILYDWFHPLSKWNLSRCPFFLIRCLPAPPLQQSAAGIPRHCRNYRDDESCYFSDPQSVEQTPNTHNGLNVWAINCNQTVGFNCTVNKQTKNFDEKPHHWGTPNCSFPLADLDAHLIHGSLGPYESIYDNGTSIGSSIFAGLMDVSNIPKHRPRYIWSFQHYFTTFYCYYYHYHYYYY